MNKTADALETPLCNQRIADVIASVGNENFWWCFADLVRSLVAVDDLIVLFFMRGQPPIVLHEHTPKLERQLLERHYINGAYILDPCYQMAIKSHWGFYSFNDIVPDGFYDSELYRIYFEKSAILDEVGYLIEGEEESFINVSMTRFNDSPEFNELEKQQMQQLEVIAAAAVKEYLRQHIQSIAQEKIPLHKMMAEVLDLFATSLLTNRETDTIHLILKGYSAQSIAEHLDISINTVKLHRKNAYAKLDISSQSELFHLFIDSLSCIDDSRICDPLVAYLQVPGAQLNS